ncbi:Flavin-containing monooxygenase [Quillaja saponaria]|uniref:Flavin-containing monooxygenase n=1 Tax=Quillaja saponaria TaxID=32244 RepID=A0AAD7Q120_QUISA|nr:Flavin-containing monooxygenase [Quillaja saponaria]
MQQEQLVIIVGAGPSGLAAAGCLTQKSIPCTILEREDCIASLWKKYSYDRLHLHLRKQYCELPHMSFPPSCPSYLPKKQFIQYLDDYVSHFKISPLYHRRVELAEYNEGTEKWSLKARNINGGSDGEAEEYIGRFLVVATGETADPFIPEVEGFGDFNGEMIHSTGFKSGKAFKEKNVKIFYKGVTKYGIARPEEGPFYMKVKYGKYPVIDVGTYNKIKSGELQVLPTVIESIRGNEVVFKNGKSYPFDSIVFCTGFKRSTHLWLKGDDYLLDDNGIPKRNFPNHWKGKNSLYCVGLSRRGFEGAKFDAENIANDISSFM